MFGNVPTNILIYHPQLTFTLCMLTLVVITLSWRSPTPFIKAAMLTCLLPVLPIIVVRCLAFYIVELCDWLTIGRIWTIPSVAAARWFESKLEI